MRFRPCVKGLPLLRKGEIIQLEEIEALRKKQLKRVEVEFEDKSGSTAFAAEGIQQSGINRGNGLSFMYSGDINELVSSLSSRRIANITIEEPSLEEIFMHYYQ
ncbi:MAG: DUF4162 domain-containing protein [Sphingobacterium sp.]|nr:DUF4162 domain-containing protein [Sphingobacterium sp.]